MKTGTMWIVDGWCVEANDWVAIAMHPNKVKALKSSVAFESCGEITRMYMHMYQIIED